LVLILDDYIVYKLRGKSFSDKKSLLSFLNSNEYNTLEKGQCKNCLQETENIWYVLCLDCCLLSLLREKRERIQEEIKMDYKVDKQVYIAWEEGKVKAIAEMNTTEEIAKRIEEVKLIEFFALAEYRLLNQRNDVITGRKGIPPWLKADRDKLISDPNFKVNWEGEPRPKKEKKPKEDKVKNLLGFDMKALTQELKESMKGSNGKEDSKEEDKPVNMGDAISFLIGGSSSSTPSVSAQNTELTEEERKAKVEAMKEKMRLARLNRKAE
jgi:hypothetical protein